ncbi:uncharacterized protein LOC124313317 isoform X3 [Daphnia pulicaria]|uniref:uncharacterized protein LOC124313317 isoform X3 n=1 Tax=Daphnia pulicaria TaxID=35523 RepID=UPI001EEA4A85|nr:uncharacterized protein LOC124313317 isoform X3 [Daphnia pulicaria]
MISADNATGTFPHVSELFPSTSTHVAIRTYEKLKLKVLYYSLVFTRFNQLHFVGYQMSVKQRYQHQRFDYLVAIDLKTSVVGLPGKSHQTEIVEVNAVAVNTLNLDRQKAFAGCCHPDLADFSFVETIRKFSQWLFQLNGPFILVTDNYNTLGSDFPNQCLISGLNVPTFAAEWLNICEFWRQRYGNQNKVI